VHRPIKIGSELIYDDNGRVRRALVLDVHSQQCVDLKISRQAPHRDLVVKRVPVTTERRRGCAMRGGLLRRLQEEFGR
jgi:hypothetical protein